MKEKIVEILMNTLDYAYCDNCGATNCDECNRKSQNWSLGEPTAERIAEKIIELIQ